MILDEHRRIWLTGINGVGQSGATILGAGDVSEVLPGTKTPRRVALPICATDGDFA